MSASAKKSAGAIRQQIDVCLDADIVEALADRLRLANHERRTAGWLHAAVAALATANEPAPDRRPWSEVL